MQEDIKTEIRKSINEENETGIADAKVSGGFAEIKGVAFSDKPIAHLMSKTVQLPRFERFKSLFKRKPNLNGTIAE